MMVNLEYNRLHTSLNGELLDPLQDPKIKNDRVAKTTEREDAR
jgi:hypothetical protein